MLIIPPSHRFAVTQARLTCRPPPGPVEGGVEVIMHLLRVSVSGRTLRLSRIARLGRSVTRLRLDLALGDSPPLCAVRLRTTHWERGSPNAAFPVVVVYRFNIMFHDFP